MASRKVYTHGGDVKISAPEGLDARDLANILDPFPRSAPLAQVEAALASVGAHFAPWDNGSPGHSGLWNLRDDARTRNHLTRTLFRERVQEHSRRNPRVPVYPAVALEAGAQAEGELLAAEKLAQHEQRRAKRTERAAIGGAVVGVGIAAIAVFTIARNNRQ